MVGDSLTGKTEDFDSFNIGSTPIPRSNQHRCNMELTGTLKNAKKAWLYDDKFVVIGDIYGDSKNRFDDGTKIKTSVLVSENGDTITTRNSLYKVEWQDDKIHNYHEVMK